MRMLMHAAGRIALALIAMAVGNLGAGAESIEEIIKRHGKGGTGASPPAVEQKKDKTEILPSVTGKKKTVQDDLTDECDRLTAADFDQDLPAGVKRVFFDDIDLSRAIPACERAMEAHPDDRRMIFQLARAYHVAKRYDEATPLYDRAAAMGSVAAMNNIGAQYADGVGRPRDYGQAIIWYRKAVDRGSPRATYNLGLMYMDGDGVAVDADEAARLLILSVEGKNEDLVRRFEQKAKFTQAVIRRVQRHLVDEGYMDGKPDGKIGAATIRAMKAWRQDIGF